MKREKREEKNRNGALAGKVSECGMISKGPIFAAQNLQVQIRQTRARASGDILLLPVRRTDRSEKTGEALLDLLSQRLSRGRKVSAAAMACICTCMCVSAKPACIGTAA